MLPAASNCKLRCGGRGAGTTIDGGRLQPPRPLGAVSVDHYSTGFALGAPLLGSSPTAARSGGVGRRPHLITAAAISSPANDLLQPSPSRLPAEQLQWPNSDSAGTSAGTSTSSLSTEALRPRRFSAPVIARLLRSTTSLQALADVVQQQSPYLDIPLVTVALLHMALLSNRQQQRQPPTVTTARELAIAGSAAAAAGPGAGSASNSGSSRNLSDGSATASSSSSSGGSSSSSNNGNGNGNSNSNGYGVDQMTFGAVGQPPPQPPQGYEDDGLPLQMSSLLDDDNDDDNEQQQQEAAEGIEDGDVAAAQPSSLLDDAAAAAAAAASSSSASSSAPPASAAYAAPSPVASSLRILVPLVLSNLDGVGGSDLSKVVSALAVLRYDNKVVLEQLLQVLSLKLVECSPQELSNVLVSLALLGVPPDPYVRSNIYSAVKYQSRRFGPRDLALTIWAYGAMGTDVQEDAVLVLLEASKPKLAAFSPLHLAKAVQGLAALRYRPPPEWAAAYCEALRPALRRTASRELCAVLLALADLQVSLDDTTRATLLVHTLTALPSLEPPELARAIWALGRLTSAGLPVPALIDLDTSSRVLDVTLARLRGGAFSGGELAQLLEGLTRLALQPPLEWMQAYVAVLQPQLGALEPRQLAGVLGSLAAQQYRPEPEMQRVIMAATQDNMGQLLADTTSTASLITALRRLNIEPPPAWVAALLEASRSALKNRCTDLHLANMAGALAAWGVAPDGRWAARLMWRSQVLMQQGRMSPRALVALLQAMSALGLRPNRVWTDLCLYTAASRSASPDFEPQHFATLLPALHALGVQPPQEWLGRLMLSMYRCWGRYSVTHWSSMLPALVLLRAEPPSEWLQRLEEVTAPRLSDCSALQLLTLLVALAQLRGLSAEAMEAAAAAARRAAAGPATATAAPTAAAPAASASTVVTRASTSASNSRGTVGTDFLSPSRQPDGAAAEEEGLPRGPWLAAWWAASGGLLRRVRYAPSELLLTASWLVSLGMRPPSEWLEACIDVSQRYSKVMGPSEQMQLAAAVLPLAGHRANVVATKHSRRRQPATPPPAAAPAAAAASGPAGDAAAALPPPPATAGKGAGRRRRQGRRSVRAASVQ